MNTILTIRVILFVITCILTVIEWLFILKREYKRGQIVALIALILCLIGIMFRFFE